MNQARIWLVVKPTVGLPLFLGTVLTISLLIHFAVLTHTTWMGSFWQGGAKTAHSSVAAISAPAPTAPAAQ
jgi:light-harvesting protein B-800-850 alpha chain